MSNYALMDVKPVFMKQNVCNNDIINNKNATIKYTYKKFIVFDYDDTILPTSWITEKNKLTLNGCIPNNIKVLFKKLSDEVIKTLIMCISQGVVVIVTNASLEWLCLSAMKFIPDVWDFIYNKNLKIISARDRLINTSIDPQHWKIYIFHDIIKEMVYPYLSNKSYICCIFSIGDGYDERNACFAISQMNQFASCRFKSLKFLTAPSCLYLIAEHKMFRRFYKYMYIKL